MKRWLWMFLAGALALSGGRSALADESGYSDETESAPPQVIVPGALTLKLSGQLRVREELFDAIYSPANPLGDESYDFLHMRSRLRVDVEVSEGFAAVFELQDVRRFGEEGKTANDTEGMDIKRATIVIKKQDMKLEIGRYVMAYGDHRIIGSLEWVDQGRTYDGARISYAPDGYFFDGFYSRIRDDKFSTDDKELFGVYAGAKNLPMTLEAYAIYYKDYKLATVDGDGPENGFATLGLRVASKKGSRLDYKGEFAYQTGDLFDRKLNAYAFAVLAGYRLSDGGWKPRIGVEFDYATGDDADAEKTEQFQTIAPTNHMHYGYADLMGWSNMMDIRASFRVHPSKTLRLTLDWHRFSLAETTGAWINAAGQVVRAGTTEDVSSNLGDEIDFVFNWKAGKGFAVQGGVAAFFPGAYVDDTGDGDSPAATFAYLQTMLKF